MVNTDQENGGEDWRPTFYVGQHESKRAGPITSAILDQAYNCNYDMLTTPITTDAFQSRVHGLLSDQMERLPKTTDAQPVPLAPKIPPLTVHDTNLTPEDITSKLFAFVSPWIDLCSPDPMVSGISKQILYLEVAYAAFCGIEHVFLPAPRLYHGQVRTHGAAQYARAVQEVLSIGSHVQFHLNLPMSDFPEDGIKEDWNLASFTQDEYLDQADEARPAKVDWYGTWEVWNLIRTVCKYSSRLFVALSIPQTLPPLEIQSRWYSEPMKIVSLHSTSFGSNAAGYPTLSKVARGFIGRLMRLKNPPWILLCDVGPIPGLQDPDERVSVADGFLSSSASASPSPTPSAAGSKPKPPNTKHEHALSHLNYIRHLQRKQPARSPVERYGSGYQDYLQIPLQPLADNLESMTYEVFEKDPIKYNLYEEAIRKALRDWKKDSKPVSSPSGKVVIAVAGAGRGPLVTRALRASEAEGVEIEVWAVEKNPNAYVLLQRLEYNEWRGRVTVVQTDMRSWKGPWREDVSFLDSKSDASVPTKPALDSAPRPGHGPIDILISELLGSFADNELSPECLDGILHLLQPAYGISIPRSYTAYLTPIAAPKLHADISSRSSYDPTAPETPSVVWLHSIDYLSQQAEKKRHEAVCASQSADTDPGPVLMSTPHVLPAWSFHHRPMTEKASDPIDNRHNERFARLTFRTRDRGVCHGLAGYFEAVLYPGVELSTNPLTMEKKSPDMISWFPIFFPLKTPLSIPDHASLTVSIWRQTDDRKVWYEWLLEAWGLTMMIGGEHRRVKLGVSDLHSSIKGGCLM